MYMSGRNLQDGVAVSCFANGLNLTKVLCPISMLLDSSGGHIGWDDFKRLQLVLASFCHLWHYIYITRYKVQYI